MDARDIANSILLARLSREYAPPDNTFAPVEYPNGVQLPPPPTYPEVNPTYPGPFLRDPAELNPDDEWRTRV